MLGFFVLFEVPGQLVHLRREKYQDILFKPADGLNVDPSTKSLGQGVSMCFSVGSVADVNRLGSHAAQLKATIIEGPVDRPWNVREIVLHDPDGYRLAVSGGPIADVNFAEVFPGTSEAGRATSLAVSTPAPSAIRALALSSSDVSTSICETSNLIDLARDKEMVAIR